MKLGVIWNSLKKATGTLVDRALGKSAAQAESKIATTTAGKAAGAPRIGNYDDAFQASRSLGQLSELGLVEPAKFARTAGAVLDSPQSGNFASEVARHTAAAMKDNPNSTELLSTLAKSHKQLDKNISQRMQQAKLMDDPAELRALHTNNIRDARAIIDTGAPATLRDDAFKDIARSLDGLMSADPAAARRITQELSKDPMMMKGVGDAARAMRSREAAEATAHAAKPAAPAARPAVIDSDHEWANERLRNLGVLPRTPHTAAPATTARAPELMLVDDAVPSLGSYPSSAPSSFLAGSTPTQAWGSISRGRQLSPAEEYAARQAGTHTPAVAPGTNILRPTQVDGMHVEEVSMDLVSFRALQDSWKPPVAGPTAAAPSGMRPIPSGPVEVPGMKVEEVDFSAFERAVGLAGKAKPVTTTSRPATAGLH